MTAHSTAPVLVKTLRRELAVSYSLESPESLLQFYRRTVLIQAAANILAQEWNRHLGLNASKPISFVELAVYWLDARKEYGLIEHCIDGIFRKFSDSDGNASEESQNVGLFLILHGVSQKVAWLCVIFKEVAINLLTLSYIQLEMMRICNSSYTHKIDTMLESLIFLLPINAIAFVKL
jgi:hypothetical protein